MPVSFPLLQAGLGPVESISLPRLLPELPQCIMGSLVKESNIETIFLPGMSENLECVTVNGSLFHLFI